MRIHQRHQRQKTVIGNAENTDLAIALRNVFDEPVDRVIRVSRMIDIRRIQRPTQRSIHYVVAFRTVLAAHVLHDPNVAALDNHFERVVIAV